MQALQRLRQETAVGWPNAKQMQVSVHLSQILWHSLKGLECDGWWIERAALHQALNRQGRTLQVSPEQGRFLSWLVGALGVKHAIELGVFTGYSAVCIAQVTAFQN